jgi:prevent-host-death family protein
MEKATISQMRNHLSAYLQKVRAGESVLILDRNTPVARLEGIKADAHDNERLVRLEREGLLRRPKGPIPMKQLRTAPPRAKQSVLEALLEEREEGR